MGGAAKRQYRCCFLGDLSPLWGKDNRVRHKKPGAVLLTQSGKAEPECFVTLINLRMKYVIQSSHQEYFIIRGIFLCLLWFVKNKKQRAGFIISLDYRNFPFFIYYK